MEQSYPCKLYEYLSFIFFHLFQDKELEKRIYLEFYDKKSLLSTEQKNLLFRKNFIFLALF